MSDFTIEKGYFGPKVRGKLGAQRKPQTYNVSPVSDGTIMVQSDKAIGNFDPETGEGILNIKGCYFPHLSPALGAKPYTFPADFVTLCKEVLPLEKETTVGGFTLVNEIKVI